MCGQPGSQRYTLRPASVVGENFGALADDSNDQSATFPQTIVNLPGCEEVRTLTLRILAMTREARQLDFKLMPRKILASDTFV